MNSNTMDDSLLSRLKQWMTPEHPTPALSQPPLVPVLRSSFRLYVLGIDPVSRGLLDPSTRQLSYERLRDRLFPHLGVRIDAADVDELMHEGRELWLTRAASVRWMASAKRGANDIQFSFLYLPFAVVVDGLCLASGWVVPPSSNSPFPYSRLHASFGTHRVALRLLPGPGQREDPAEAMRQARL